MEKKKAEKTGTGKPPRIMKHAQSVVINDGDPTTLICTIKCKKIFPFLINFIQMLKMNNRVIAYETNLYNGKYLKLYLIPFPCISVLFSIDKLILCKINIICEC